jgi:glycosyltransferase involved in cell wall biosynthesis
MIEAMACHKPAISTNTGVALDLMLENAVLVYNFGDYEGLTNHLLNVLSDDNYAEKIADRGLALVKKLYNWDSIVDEHVRLYEKLLHA